MSNTVKNAPHVGLFVTCLIDLIRPNVGFAAVKLLEDAGCEVSVPRAQTCCGQPAHNAGDTAGAAAIARQVIAAFEGFDYVVGASGSCMGMLKKHYPMLFAGDPAWRARALKLAAKTYELTSFLFDVLKIETLAARYEGALTYHDSCSGLRELGIQKQPRALLALLGGAHVEEMTDSDVCCGFGGAFCVKHPEISSAMVEKKTANVANTGAPLVVGGDLGCLMHIAGKLSREGKAVKARHIAELLAGMTDEAPAIGEATSKGEGKRHG